MTATEQTSTANEKLQQKLQAITHLERAKAILSYDQLVFMPENAATERGSQMAALAAVIHEASTDASLLQLIQEAENEIGLSEDMKRLLELEKKAFLENERVPGELVSKSAELSARAYGEWVRARQDNDFASFADTLSDCFATAKEIAEAKREDDTTSPYAQMLDAFEMGMKPERIDEIFGKIQDKLVPLIQRVLASKTPPSTEALKGTFDVEKQKELNRKIVTAMGFDESRGRIDVSVHPFTTSFSPKDVRITSRFREDEWYQGLAGSIHEGGHAIYEQNLPNEATSLNTALSMGAHESQSLFWERHVGLSQRFWEWATPLVKESFPDFNYTPKEVYGAVNAVSQSLIRVEADELTYPLHVILRYGIERDIVEGRLDAKDMPERWNKSMKEMLNIDVPSNTKGCLQDVHWPSLAIGYFPTYLVGSATAAQLAHYIKKDMPDFDEKVSRGEFKELKDWLHEKIHRHGKRYASLDAMLVDQLGEELNPVYFIDYLTEKYSTLYQC